MDQSKINPGLLEEPVVKGQVGGNHYDKMRIHPAYYAQVNELNFYEGSVVKYVSRHKDKNGAEDIRKAINYLEELLRIEYGETI